MSVKTIISRFVESTVIEREQEPSWTLVKSLIDENDFIEREFERDTIVESLSVLKYRNELTVEQEVYSLKFFRRLSEFELLQYFMDEPEYTWGKVTPPEGHWWWFIHTKGLPSPEDIRKLNKLTPA